MKKIAVISSSYLPSLWNGPGRSAFNTAFGLTNAGYKVTVFAFTPETYTHKKIEGQILVNYVGGVTALPQTSVTIGYDAVDAWEKKVYDLLELEDFDIIILNGWQGYRAAKAYGRCKIICFVSALHTFTGWVKNIETGKQEDIKERENECIFGVDVLVAHNSAFGQRLVTYTDREVVIIPNCYLDVSNLPEKPYTPVQNRIGFVGKVDREKNIERVIRAIAEIPDAHLTIATDERITGHFSVLANLATHKDVEHRLAFIGWLAHPVVKDFYKTCSLVVVPSNFEPFGFAALDPISCGVPVLVSEWSNLEEYVGDRDLVFSSMNELIEKMRNVLNKEPEELIALGKERRALMLEQYAEPIVTSQLISLF